MANMLELEYWSSKEPSWHPTQWKLHGNSVVPLSRPLKNLIDEIQGLTDPDFEHPILMRPESIDFLKPLAPETPPGDIRYLNAKEALTIPDAPLRNELLWSYVK
jgi:hypothetical protein